MSRKSNLIIEQMFRRSTELLRNSTTKRDYVDNLYFRFYEGKYKERRKKALLSYFNRAAKELPALCKQETAFGSFVAVDMTPIFNYNLTDYAGALRVGAALWILEQLDKAGKLEEAMQYLPDMYEIYEEHEPMFNIEHLRYPKELIEDMTLAITLRYVPDNQVLTIYQMASAVITEDMMNGYKIDENYRKLIELLPKEEIDKVCDQFRQKVWELVRLIMNTLKVSSDKLNGAEKEINLYKKNMAAPLAAPINKTLDLDVVPQSDYFFVKNEKPVGYTSALMDGIREKKLFRKFNNEIPRLLHESKETLIEEGFEPKVAEALKKFKITDPYGLCFAMFQLVDMDDDAPWLTYFGGVLMAYIYGMLPWGDAYSETDMKFISGRPSNKWCNGANEIDAIKGQGNTYDYFNYRKNKVNIAQMLFRAGRVVIPSKMPLYYGTADAILEDDTDDTLRMYAAVTTGLMRTQKLEMPEKKEMEEPVVEEEPEENIAEEVVHLREALKQLKFENKVLKVHLRQSQSDTGKAERRNEEIIKASEKEHQELIDLRELLFNKENEVEEEVEEESPIQYPYKLKKQMTVFGGHDTFVKVMKANFPDARFIDNKANPDVIKNSDIVWVQSNCISHSLFWNVVKFANLYHKQLRYFVAAGTERCSKQMVKADEQ